LFAGALINKYTIGAAIAIFVVISVYFYGIIKYNKGYNTRDLEAQVEMKDLKLELEKKKSEAVDKQIAANKKAQENSQKQILQMQVEKDQLEKLIEDMEIEASKEPNRDRIGLDASSVMRINKIR
jgi:septal ring factor EnvC (AmiA/AmiB activator)